MPLVRGLVPSPGIASPGPDLVEQRFCPLGQHLGDTRRILGTGRAQRRIQFPQQIFRDGAVELAIPLPPRAQRRRRIPARHFHGRLGRRDLGFGRLAQPHRAFGQPFGPGPFGRRGFHESERFPDRAHIGVAFLGPSSDGRGEGVGTGLGRRRGPVDARFLGGGT